MSELEKTRRERDLYRRLLELGAKEDLDSFLREALALVVEVTNAHQGYLELSDERDDGEGSRWSIAHGFTGDEVETVRTALSRGIIAEAIATGTTVHTPSAALDPRFRDRGSVQVGQIDAVLCTPIGDAPPVGVLYLQRKARGPFADDDQRTAGIFARHVAPLVDRLLVRHRQDPDPTAALRARLRVGHVIGRSAALANVLQQVALVAPLETNVLLTGDTGTGKSQIARVIHDNSPRAGGPFVELNCAAIPEELVESELFGALPGAHSTAVRRVEGKVGAAARGTLFLDEIGELSLAAQAKLLHLLQTRQYYPLGSPKPLQADIRVIAATNLDLAAAVAARRFREDLFYRLQVLPIRVPTLAERREDVPDLAAHFCALTCERHRLPHLALSREARHALQSAEWAGNVRQLAHTIEAAAIRAAGEGARAIERAHLFPEANGGGADAGAPEKAATFQAATRRFQTALLREALAEADWNIAEVARRLDLARSHVYNLIRAFAIAREGR